MPIKRDPGWSEGDINYAVRLTKQSGGDGRWVYLTREHILHALLGGGSGDLTPKSQGGVGARAGETVPDDLRAIRIVLDPGTGQILLRLRRGP